MARRTYLTLALGAACSLPVVLLVRHAASAQRHRAATVTPDRSGVQRVASSVARDEANAADAPIAAVGSAHARAATPIEGVVEGFEPTRIRREGDRYVSDLPDGRRATLTLDPTWQRATQRLLDQHELPRASVVVMDTDTGRVRVYVSRGEPGAPDLARDTAPPAASVFKIVTSSALLPRGVGDSATTCYDGGGFHALRLRDLTPSPGRDRECVTLAEAFGRSINTVFARRALERLSPSDLLGAAQGWGFGETLPFDAPARAGDVDVPEERLEFGRTAAGFWHSHLSPLHGAMIAQAIARGGEMLRPYMIDQLYDASGEVAQVGASHVFRRAIPSETAQGLSRMMLHSVSGGTAYRAFHDDAGRAFLPGVEVGGKTGTLTAANPYRAYTWFVGNASSANARLSFAVMVANGPVWRVKAATVARQVLQIALRGRSTD